MRKWGPFEQFLKHKDIHRLSWQLNLCGSCSMELIQGLQGISRFAKSVRRFGGVGGDLTIFGGQRCRTCTSEW